MRKLLLLALATVLFLPLSTHAESILDSSGLRQTAGTTNQYDTADGAENITVFIGFYVIQPILGLLGLVFFLLMLYAGLLWMTAGGNGDQVKKAQQIFLNSVIGLVIIAASYALTAAVFNALTDGSITGTTTTTD